MNARLWICFVALVVSAAAVRAAAPGRPSLDGTWEVTQMIENGVPVGSDVLRNRYVADSRFTIAGNTIRFVRPDKGVRKLAFVSGQSAGPRTIDLAGTESIGSRGIYAVDGDVLLLCLAAPEASERPRGFASPSGSNQLLVVLQRTPGLLNTVSRTTAIDLPPPPPAVPAVPARSQQEIDGEMRRALIGTWGHQDSDKVEMTTLNEGGTMSFTRTWKKGFRKVFQDTVRSSGTWKLTDGVLVVTITASTDRDHRGQVYSFRIRNLTPTEILYVDQAGNMRREWKTVR